MTRKVKYADYHGWNVAIIYEAAAVTPEAAYESARAALLELINSPEKHLPVSEYRAHLQAAQKAHDDAYNALHPEVSQ